MIKLNDFKAEARVLVVNKEVGSREISYLQFNRLEDWLIDTIKDNALITQVTREPKIWLRYNKGRQSPLVDFSIYVSGVYIGNFTLSPIPNSSEGVELLEDLVQMFFKKIPVRDL